MGAADGRCRMDDDDGGGGAVGPAVGILFVGFPVVGVPVVGVPVVDVGVGRGVGRGRR